MGFRLGIIDKMSIKHHFGGTGNYPTQLPKPYDGWRFLFNKFENVKPQKPKILKYIYLKNINLGN
jgi:hypothetical protein